MDTEQLLDEMVSAVMTLRRCKRESAEATKNCASAVEALYGAGYTAEELDDILEQRTGSRF